MFFTKKALETAKQKGARRKNPIGLSPRNRKACHRISTRVAMILATTMSGVVVQS
jgi:hypothetical protein